MLREKQLILPRPWHITNVRLQRNTSFRSERTNTRALHRRARPRSIRTRRQVCPKAKQGYRHLQNKQQRLSSTNSLCIQVWSSILGTSPLGGDGFGPPPAPSGKAKGRGCGFVGLVGCVFALLINTATLSLASYGSFLSHSPLKRFARSSSPGTLMNKGVFGICCLVHSCSVATNVPTFVIRVIHDRSSRGNDSTNSNDGRTTV